MVIADCDEFDLPKIVLASIQEVHKEDLDTGKGADDRPVPTQPQSLPGSVCSQRERDLDQRLLPDAGELSMYFFQQQLLSQIQPLPPSTENRQGQESIPGAHPGPRISFDRPRVMTNLQSNVVDTNVNASSESQDLEPVDDLVVANLVDGESLLDLPQAEAVFGASDAARNRQEKIKQFNTKILLGVIFALALGMILLLVLFPDRKGASSNGASSEMTNSPSPPPTTSPSPPPTTFEQQSLFLFPEDSIIAIMESVNSSQSMAFQWLLQDTKHHTESLLDERTKQRFALATLYFATNGDHWYNNTNWLNHTVHECEWYNKPSFAHEVIVSQQYPLYLQGFTHLRQAPRCNDDGIYKHLWLDQNNLEGSLPEELYMLTALQTLSVGLDRLHGTISTRVGQISHLEGLKISRMENAGVIPSEIGLLTHMKGLGFPVNNHQEFIPTELWRLSNLETLHLGENPDLKGSIATEIATMSKLRWFSIDGASLTGEFNKFCSTSHLVLHGAHSICLPHLATHVTKARSRQNLVNCSIFNGSHSTQTS
jgi:hypothetical protein